MRIAKAQYRNSHFQTAAITIWKRAYDYYIKTDIGGQSLTQPPEWSQVATTEADARAIGNHFHHELKAIYQMQHIAKPPRTGHHPEGDTTMAYVDRTLTQAEQALRCILDAAPACIERLPQDSLNRRTAEALLATAHRGAITGIAAQHRPALASYAATMHRQPPHPRTILTLLRLVQPA